jgi:glutamate-1-semialdehyde 2,1-aminomutase
LEQPGVYSVLEDKARYLAEGLESAAAAAEIPTVTNRVGSMGCSFFTANPVVDLATAQLADTQAFAVFFREMLRQGVYLAPSQFEAFFVSLAHQRSDLDRTVDAAAGAFKKVGEQRVRAKLHK